MLEAALDAGVPCAWVTADALYGSDKTLRVMLERRRMPHVLAVRTNERLMAGGVATRTAARIIADEIDPDAWRRLSAGAGAKGLRLYDWARVRLFRPQAPPWDHWLLARRSIVNPDDIACYVVFAPDTAGLGELAAVAGLRWTIEACFRSAKGEAGLDHCEARSWAGWHRHMTLSMLALAYLVALRAGRREARHRAAEAKPNKKRLAA